MAEQGSIKPGTRFFYLDVLRALAIVAVVFLHNSDDAVEHYGKISSADWLSASLYNGLTRFCVPMFIVISGSLLLNPAKETNIRELFTKRLPKLVIPLVAWSIIYVIFQNYTKHIFSTYSLPMLLKAFYQGPLIFHFWFLYLMIGIYLLSPIINLFIKSATEAQVLYFLVLWFVTNCVFGVIQIAFETPVGLELFFFTGYVGYFVLGYYLRQFDFTKKALHLLYAMGIAAFIISVAGIILMYNNHFGHAGDLVEDDFTPEIPFAVAGLFLFFKNRKFRDQPRWWKTVITEVSSESYGIYIVHVLIMRVFFDSSIYNLQFPGLGVWGLVPLKSAAILLLSYGLVKLIKWVPFLRATV